MNNPNELDLVLTASPDGYAQNIWVRNGRNAHIFPVDLSGDVKALGAQLEAIGKSVQKLYGSDHLAPPLRRRWHCACLVHHSPDCPNHLQEQVDQFIKHVGAISFGHAIDVLIRSGAQREATIEEQHKTIKHLGLVIREALRAVARYIEECDTVPDDVFLVHRILATQEPDGIPKGEPENSEGPGEEDGPWAEGFKDRSNGETQIKDARESETSPIEDTSIYGTCPICGAPGVSRERRPNGDDKCAKGHFYPSAEAIHGADVKRPD